MLFSVKKPFSASGDISIEFALNESETGSDSKSIRTVAIPDGEHYFISGRKKWITAGKIADMFLVYAQVDYMYVVKNPLRYVDPNGHYHEAGMDGMGGCSSIHHY